MVNFIFFSNLGMVKLLQSLHIISNMKKNIFQMKIFKKITLCLFIIHSFIELKVLVSLPKVSMVHLTMKMHCNWPTDHAIDHISIELNNNTVAVQ